MDKIKWADHQWSAHLIWERRYSVHDEYKSEVIVCLWACLWWVSRLDGERYGLVLFRLGDSDLPFFCEFEQDDYSFNVTPCA